MNGWIPKYHIDVGAGCFAFAMGTILQDRIVIPQCLCEPSGGGWFAQNIYRRIGSDSHQEILIVSRIDRVLYYTNLGIDRIGGRSSTSDDAGTINFYYVFKSSGIFSACSQLRAECNCSLVRFLMPARLALSR
jgi:hypothetical protein